jgi:hypothetical protein
MIYYLSHKYTNFILFLNPPIENIFINTPTFNLEFLSLKRKNPDI